MVEEQHHIMVDMTSAELTSKVQKKCNNDWEKFKFLSDHFLHKLFQ